MEPLAVDIREAARLVSLSPYTIRAYVKSGRLASVRVGRRVLIEPREITRLIEKGRTQPSTTTENGEGQ
jgi:excisionase family DNA binding protein